MSDQVCTVDACGRDARKAGLCWGHYKRKMRDQPVNVQLAERGHTDWERLMLAFERYQAAEERIGEKDAQTALRRARWRLEHAIQSYRRRAVSRENKKRVGR